MKKIFLITPFLLSPLLAFAHYGDDMFDHHMDMTNYGYFGGGFFVVIFWILIIIGIIYLVKYLSHGKRDKQGGEDSAIKILKERYAKGEMSKEEFEEKKKDIAKN